MSDQLQDLLLDRARIATKNQIDLAQEIRKETKHQISLEAVLQALATNYLAEATRDTAGR